MNQTTQVRDAPADDPLKVPDGPVDVIDVGPPSAVVLDRYLTHRLRVDEVARETWRDERYTLRRFLDFIGRRPLSRVSRRDLERWRAEHLARLAPGTRYKEWQTVRRFFDWCVAEDRIRRSPFVGLKPPKVPTAVSYPIEEPSRLWDGALDSRDAVILVLGLQEGMRRAEIAALQVGDVSFSDDTVRVTRGSKGGHQRVLALTDEARRVLRAHLMATRIAAGPLLLNDRGGPATARWVGGRFQAMAERAGVKHGARDGVTPHALRHRAATDVYRNTRDLLAVQEMLGHASPATTRRYIQRLAADELRDVMGGRSYRPRSEASDGVA